MSTRNPGSPVTDGRLNLEQQRKRAKDLLKAATANDRAAQQRFADSLRTTPETPKLADAQRVIALDNGFPSWPRMKRHIEAVDYARRHVGERGDRDRRTLHIRCGSDIQHSLKIAGFVGEFLEFSDPFCMGPVQTLPLEEHLQSRARFISGSFDITEADALARQRKAYGALDALGDYQRIVLWFERDSYDQLILAYLLMRLGEMQLAARLELIAVDHVPGVERFIGIGQLAPELLAWLWQQRRPLAPGQLSLGEDVWAAFTAQTPEALYELARHGTSALPMMGIALLRQLQELPSLQNGLSLTEQLTLEIVQTHGSFTLGKAYGELMREREPLPWLGDTMFGRIAHSMAEGASPLIAIAPVNGEFWFQDIVSLTPAGEAVLAGRLHRLDMHPAERWVGGVVTPGAGGSWCWDHETAQPVWRTS